MGSVKKISIVITDDHALFRRGLVSLLKDFDFISAISEASNGRELLDLLQKTRPLPDIILLDINMPVMDGVDAAKEVRKLFPSVKIIILTMEDNEQFVLQMIENGANGYLLKNSEPEELEQAIKTIMDRDFYFTDNISNLIRKAYIQVAKKDHGFHLREEFSKRELEVLTLICREYTSQEIAGKLYLSRRTIESHRNNMIAKAGVKNLAGLIVYALKNELVKI